MKGIRGSVSRSKINGSATLMNIIIYNFCQMVWLSFWHLITVLLKRVKSTNKYKTLNQTACFKYDHLDYDWVIWILIVLDILPGEPPKSARVWMICSHFRQLRNHRDLALSTNRISLAFNTPYSWYFFTFYKSNQHSLNNKYCNQISRKKT